MDERDKANIEGLKETLKSAAESGTDVHIRSKDAGEYAQSLQRSIDEQSGKDADAHVGSMTVVVSKRRTESTSL